MRTYRDRTSLGAMLTADTGNYLDELARWRADRDDFFANHYATPLSDEVIAAFTGIRYFPPDPSLVFELGLQPLEVPIAIEASTGTTSDYPAAGKVTVPFAAGPVDLWVLSGEEGEHFVPFRDATSGVSTYSGGRYLALDHVGERRLTLDFNKATNPYCAYDPDFSCPLPPPENRLGFPVEAGELDY